MVADLRGETRETLVNARRTACFRGKLTEWGETIAGFRSATRKAPTLGSDASERNVSRLTIRAQLGGPGDNIRSFRRAHAPRRAHPSGTAIGRIGPKFTRKLLSTACVAPVVESYVSSENISEHGVC